MSGILRDVLIKILQPLVKNVGANQNLGTRDRGVADKTDILESLNRPGGTRDLSDTLKILESKFSLSKPSRSLFECPQEGQDRGINALQDIPQGPMFNWILKGSRYMKTRCSRPMRYLDKNIGSPKSRDMTNIMVEPGIMVPTSNDFTEMTNLGITTVHMDTRAQDLHLLGGKSHPITGKTHFIGEMLMDMLRQTDHTIGGKTHQTLKKSHS